MTTWIVRTLKDGRIASQETAADEAEAFRAAEALDAIFPDREVEIVLEETS